MKKSILALIMSALILVATLAGCSNPAETSSPSPEASSAASSEAAGTEDAEASEEPSAEPALRVALIFGSVISDGGWNQDAYNEMLVLAEEYNLDVSYQENVGDTAAADAIRNYANDGYDLIIDNEQYHSEIMAEIAPEYPDITFACVNGYVAADNMISITGDMWQHIYLSGIMGAAVSETDKLGLITYSTTSDSALKMLTAYTDGAKMANPDCEVIHVATGSFSDLAKGKEMCLSLIDQGCDVILCNSGDCNPTVIQTCIDEGVYSISAIVDRNDMSEDYLLGSAMMPSSNMLDIIVEGYLDGSLTGSPDVTVMGLAEGAEEFRINPSMLDKLDQSVLDMIDQATADIISGEITITLP